MEYYLIATVGVVLLGFLAHMGNPEKYADLMGISVMFSLVFVTANLIVTLYGFPESILAFPVLDLSLAAMIYRASLRNRAWWKIGLVGTLVMQLVLHLSAVFAWKTGGLTQGSLYQYVVGVNVVYILQLGILALIGGGYVVGRVGRVLSGRWRSHPVPDGF